MDYEKLEILYADGRVQPRSKLAFALLESGLTLQEVIDFPAENIGELKNIKNGERFFMQYVKGIGVMERISRSNLLFPGTEGKPMQEIALLTSLRRACRVNGFQLHQLQIEGLVRTPLTGAKSDNFIGSAEGMSFDEVVNFIQKK